MVMVPTRLVWMSSAVPEMLRSTWLPAARWKPLVTCFFSMRWRTRKRGKEMFNAKTRRREEMREGKDRNEYRKLSSQGM